MLILLSTVLGLSLWSLRLMIMAFLRRDFSLLFAGTLVSISAAGIVVVYSLMHGCMGYLATPDSGWVATPAGGDFPVVTAGVPADLVPFQGASIWVDEVPDRG
ncbi:hypothetical protein [Lyngbya confervoides]|uniref:Uncharacterized protein n=1 Tax=Lyngbya confervoides BDU141951 TaxID=1574623 RepID=A0ABD4SY38_9CYAN|nr:hypothetical protein [Lyngbya confervoides]MCM1981320.1 hypothetical protein [Lyngbya confervoides BDU141951]